jgi:hypothetical protein
LVFFRISSWFIHRKIPCAIIKPIPIGNIESCRHLMKKHNSCKNGL